MTDLRVGRARGHRPWATGMGPAAAAAPCGPLACHPHSRGGRDSRFPATRSTGRFQPRPIFGESLSRLRHRLRGGGGPGSVPGDRAPAAAFLKSASCPPSPGSPCRGGPQGWREPGVRSLNPPRPRRRRAESRPALWERLVAQGAARTMSLFPSTPLVLPAGQQGAAPCQTWRVRPGTGGWDSV